MAERTVTISADFTIRVQDPDVAKAVVAQWTSGMTGLLHFEITGARSGSTAADDWGYEPDEREPVSEADLLAGYGRVDLAALRRGLG